MGIYIRIKKYKKITVYLIVLLISTNTYSYVGEEIEFELENDDYVSIATGSKQSVSKAPAVTTVITARDIKAMGAVDLDEILETVPGLHVSRSALWYNPIYVVRGIHTFFNPQILVLLNGIPLTRLEVGDRGQVWGGMPVANIARIEVIRGPGSAVYGADAFSGTINVYTKKSAEIDGLASGIRFGTYNTQDAWVQNSHKWKGYKYAISLQYHSTDGSDSVIDADAQTGLDALFSTNASMAPGSTNRQVDSIDTRIDIEKGPINFRLGYQSRRNVGLGGGLAQALDPVGSSDTDRYNIDMTYQKEDYYPSWDVNAQMSFSDTNEKNNFVLFPSNAFGGAFPEGVIGRPDKYERHFRLKLSTFYTAINNHKLRFGTGYSIGDEYKVNESKNFDSTGAPLGGIVDVSNNESLVFLTPHDRKVLYGFAQDEWSIASDWDLTSGVRWDNYSDFGDTFNPRLALVWQTYYNLTTKLLYGKAFRPPSFAELYGINNPVAIGNPDLNPETIETTELAFDFSVLHDVRTKLNIFYYKMEDIIRFQPSNNVAANGGTQNGKGVEWEVRWNVNSKLQVLSNFAHQISIDNSTNTDAGNAPRNQLYGRVDWRFMPRWFVNTQVNYVADRKRVAGDTRENIDDYTTVDLNLRRTHMRGLWEWAIAVRNIFDEDAREPSQAPGSIPNDLPLAGRSLYTELRYRL